MNLENPAGGKYPAKPQAMIGRKSGHPKPTKKCKISNLQKNEKYAS